jgi:hypothetical protein
VSHDLEHIDALIDLLKTVEAGPGADKRLAANVNDTLVALTRITPAPKTAVGWIEAWAPVAQRLSVARSALGRIESQDAEERLLAWRDVSTLETPSIEVEDALKRALAVEVDPRVLEAVLGLAAKLLLARADVGRPMAHLLAKEDTRSLAHNALVQLFQTNAPPSEEVWLEIVNRRTFVPPLVTVRTKE